jgi:hypothetical protein
MNLPPWCLAFALPCLAGTLLFVAGRLMPEAPVATGLSVVGLLALLAGLWTTRDLTARLQARAAELKDKQKA